MGTASICCLCFLVTFYVHAVDVRQGIPFTVGETHVFEAERPLTGIKRNMKSNIWQFYYFCKKASGPTKKNCGNWVDERFNKIKGANNKVKQTAKGIEISKLQLTDTAFYESLPEDEGTIVKTDLFVIGHPTH